MKQEMSHLIKKEWLNTRRGFLLVEVILSTSLFVLFATAFVGAYLYGQEATVLAGERTRAGMLAQEGIDAVKSMRDVNFSALTDGTYGLVFSNGAWGFQGTQDIQGIFTRRVTVASIDSERKNVSVAVTWQQNPQRTGNISLASRITNWQEQVVALGVGILVNKVVINHGLSQTADDFAPFRVGTTTITLASSTAFPPGTYTVSEVTDSRYDRTFSGDCNASGQITIAGTSSKVCTITNEEKLSYVTIYKTVINHGLSQTANDFAPFRVGATTVTLGATTSINSGTYTVTEATSSLYNLTYSGDCFTNGTLVIGSGESKVCILTNEEIQVGGPGTSLSGLMIYGDGTNVPKYRTYNHTTNMFSAETPTFTATVGPTWIIKTSPTQHLALAGYYDSTGTLTIMCFDGATWYTEFTAASGGVGNRHRFDISFEKSTGDAMVIFSKGPHVPNQLGYRTKTGGTGCNTGWANEVLFDPVRTANDIMYVKLAQDKRAGSNLIAMTWVDTSDDISAAIWSGTAWVNEPTATTDTNVERISSSHDIENMDIEYESLSGDVMLVWGNGTGSNGTNGVRYRTCTGGTSTCTWGAVTTPPTFADDATSLDIAANPLSNEMVFASIGNAGSDLQMGYWSGSAWTNTANADTSAGTPYVGSKLVATGWLTLGSTTRSIVVYNDSTGGEISWYAGNQGVFTLQSDFVASPAMASPRGYMDIHMDPLSPDQLMYLTSDNLGDLHAKRLIITGTSTLTWSDSDGGPLETTLPQIISSPFSFAFWQH